MPSAHGTRSTPKRSTPPPTTVSTTPSKCQVCGKPFCPRRSSHIRCDACQSDFTKSKSSGKAHKASPDKKAKRTVPPKKVHSTVADEVSDAGSSHDDDDEDDLPIASAHLTSFSCICSSRGTLPSDDVMSQVKLRTHELWVSELNSELQRPT